MKKIVVVCLLLIITISLVGCKESKTEDVYTKNDISMNARTSGKNYQLYIDGEFQDTFLTGVNMGAALPGSFPGELAIPKDMYLEWFQMIHEMNAKVVRVYTTQKPAFYEALYEFNQTVEQPLYIMHGVWLNEEVIRELEDAYADDKRLVEDFVQDGIDLVDVIHGNKILEEKPGFASGTYTRDVSEYIIGWILGIEWAPNFVYNTNEQNQDLPIYEGTYLENTSDASPFEIFLTEVGDRIIDYEVTNYQYMRPLSFVNWPTTDHLSHPNEPDLREDMVSVNFNHMKQTDAFTAGLFASFHVYPYYPEFLNYSVEYSNYIDQKGNKNAYQGYLQDLINHLDMPVIVAEFGVPASRGKTHDDINQGYNQGFISETEQGEIDALLLEDIYVSGYTGAFIFTWQDEWFKRTWNTMDLDLSHRRPFWSNIQTNEQNFGLLAFDPGATQSIRYVDGETSDWGNAGPLFSTSSLDLYTAFDEKYIYLRIDTKNTSFDDESLIIPIMTSPSQGNTFITDTNISFNEQVDFYIKIDGQEYGEIFVDAYYDPFYFMYHETLGLLDKNPIFRTKNTGIFNPIYQALSAGLYLPEENRVVPFSKHNTGLLTFGVGNPNNEAYDSLSDYYIKGNTLEIRIPWLLLNISDPSTKMRLADFYLNDWFVSEEINEIYFGAQFVNEEESAEITLINTTWEPWELPTYHMRLKESYYILKEALALYE